MWGGGVSMATAGLSVWGGRLLGETEWKVQRVTDAVFVGHGWWVESFSTLEANDHVSV